MHIEEETIDVIDGLLACANTLAAIRYRGRSLGGGEQAEYRRLLALLDRGRRLVKNLQDAAETAPLPEGRELFT
jgi:hypothetical protein